MRISRSRIRQVTLYLAGLVVACAVIAPAGQFFIALADERHWYEHPSQQVAALLAFFASLSANPWFHWFGGAIVGFAIGVRMDALLRRREEGAVSAKAPISELSQPSTAQLAPSVTKPIVELSLNGARAPALVISNTSGLVAKDIKWTVLLMNVSKPDAKDPLPIPVSSFDFIRPGGTSGRQLLFTPQVTATLSSGDKLWGSMSVDCPECARGNTYLIYIDWGHGGWYYHLKDKVNGTVLGPKSASYEETLNYAGILSRAAPHFERIAISD